MKRYILLFSFTFCLGFILSAQTNEKPTRKPVFDVHVHVMKVSGQGAPLCPWFLSDMPGGDPADENPPAFFDSDCLDPLPAAASDEELQEEVVGRIRDLNMSMIAFGDPEILRNWIKASPPGRIIPGIGISNAKSMSVEAFRDSLEGGFYKVMAEVAPQYQGMSPSDPSLDPYFAVAEELNIPVGIHMGTGGNGVANLTRPNFRASLGNPELLEDLLARHPKMKIWVMHAGYPLMEEMKALMGANAYVYVDISGMIWSYPLDEIHAYIKGLVQAGFEKRIMFGTDFIMWPRMIETSMGVIEHAQYLSEEQKRDILFNNAARFFRMDKSQFDWPVAQQ
ncbi:amidohydrolase family protein [Draconibacterium sp. IB214405]|uniref:amidohydrolase family protein n=1 Tax=Draconibacterium sp. IB214405 TaxID=3097352 RepID=UPI002A0F54A8|nr:amidohydrolase family protein [Draconibacterium sp. IB214405]MDX8338944.1 amidohydrolase family protein [Draconibacterium sp. IB214405]